MARQLTVSSDRLPLRALLDLPRAIAEASNSASTMDAVFPAVLELVGRSLGWEFGHAYVYAADRNLLISSGSFHLASDLDLTQDFQESTQRATFRPGEGLPGVAFATLEPVWMDDVGQDPRFARRDSARTLGLQTAFAAPVRSGPRAVAVVEFLTTRRVERDPRIMRVMETIGTQLGRVYEREQASLALLHANEQLRQSDEVKAAFISIVSHELRTPLVAVAGLNAILQDEWRELPPGEVDDLLSSVGRHADRLQRLVGDLLTTTSLRAGNLRTEPRSVPLAARINQAVGDLLMTTDVHVRCAGDTRVRVDPDHLTQIVTNLLENARRYGAPPIQITTESVARGVAVDVRDHGPGVDPDFIERLFEQFTQGPRDVAGIEGATGLGLAIVDGLARANGGAVSYHPPEVGPGAVFRVVLPQG